MISPTPVADQINQKKSEGCVIKWRKRNSVILDCNGQLEGYEIEPTYPHSQDNLITIRHTDKKGGLKGAIQRAVQDLGGLRRYITPKDDVVMKVNAASGLSGSPSTYTNPKVIEILADEIAKVCDDQGNCARPFIAEADNIWMDFETRGNEVLENLGYMDLIDRQSRHGKPNIPFVHLTTGKLWTGKQKLPWNDWFSRGSTDPRVKFHFIHPKDFTTDLSTLLISPHTKVVSVSKPKQHMWCGISIDTKNMYGSYPDGDKSKYHQQDIEGIIAASARLQRPVLNLSDWTTVCSGWGGPAICETFEDNKVVLSNDYVCGDNIGRELAGIPDGHIEHLEINKRLNEGNPWCNFAKGSVKLEDAKNPELIKKAPPLWWFQFGRELIQTIFKLDPSIIRDVIGLNLYSVMEVVNKVIGDLYDSP